MQDIPNRTTARPGCHRNLRPGAPRPLALGPVPHACGDCARNHLGPRRAGGDARRLGGGRPQGKPGLALHRFRSRTRVELLSWRRRQRRTRVWLARGPARAASPVLRDAVAVSPVGSRDSFFLGLCELLPVPLFNWRGHRRRVQCRQFHHPGNDPGTIPRMDGPGAWRNILARRRAGRGEFDRAFSTPRT